MDIALSQLSDVNLTKMLTRVGSIKPSSCAAIVVIYLVGSFILDVVFYSALTFNFARGEIEFRYKTAGTSAGYFVSR